MTAALGINEIDRSRPGARTIPEMTDQEKALLDLLPRGAAFEWALASFGEIADEVDRIIEGTGATIAAMNARGDRIDRVQAQNRAAIEALLADARR